ncbi:hypothetical protein [Mycolicibacterium houstonense]|uniref:hypothetical protein n=1 Tax=Mycolicibacterium houstonense TaxID=146021 RepID=UPI000A0745F4|nr:hypothetical protein [Mycolicibacterium houstonense]
MFEKLARIPVIHTPATGTGEDSLGNTATVPGVPVERLAYSIGPHVEEQGSVTRTETEVADTDVAMPKYPVTLKDTFTIDGDTYNVVGLRDMTHGFHGWQPGIVVELQKVS